MTSKEFQELLKSPLNKRFSESLTSWDRMLPNSVSKQLLHQITGMSHTTLQKYLNQTGAKSHVHQRDTIARGKQLKNPRYKFSVIGYVYRLRDRGLRRVISTNRQKPVNMDSLKQRRLTTCVSKKWLRDQGVNFV